MPPPFPRKFAWPPVPPADGRRMRSTTFLIPPENVEKLREKVLAEPDAMGGLLSASDILQAFLLARCDSRPISRGKGAPRTNVRAG